MSIYSISVLGGDLRQCYLAKYMQQRGHRVTCFGTMSHPEIPRLPVVSNLDSALSEADLIVCPTPFLGKEGFLHTSPEVSKTISPDNILNALRPGQILSGGSIPLRFISSCTEKQIEIFDVMKEESLIQENASLTAEGLLPSLICNTPFSLVNRKVLLLGYGHCGMEIAKRLNSFSMDISTLDRDKSRLISADAKGITTYEPETFPNVVPDFDIIINTIPAPVLTNQQLKGIPKHCVLFDIASAPFGFNLEATEPLGLTVIRCPGIPGKMMPETAGEIIGKVILERISSYDI